jgi:FAD synthetase
MGENKAIRIMVFGTFDVLHPGHINFFKQARRLAKNPYLIVSIARDVNVRRIKGKKPLHNERQRAALVKYSGLADKVVLGGLKNHLPHIAKEKPDIIALGYDQEAYTDELQQQLPKVKVVRLKSHKINQYKSSLLKQEAYENWNRGRAGK